MERKRRVKPILLPDVEANFSYERVKAYVLKVVEYIETPANDSFFAITAKQWTEPKFFGNIPIYRAKVDSISEALSKEKVKKILEDLVGAGLVVKDKDFYSMKKV